MYILQRTDELTSLRCAKKSSMKQPCSLGRDVLTCAGRTVLLQPSGQRRVQDGHTACRGVASLACLVSCPASLRVLVMPSTPGGRQSRR